MRLFYPTGSTIDGWRCRTASPQLHLHQISFGFASPWGHIESRLPAAALLSGIWWPSHLGDTFTVARSLPSRHSSTSVPNNVPSVLSVDGRTGGHPGQSPGAGMASQPFRVKRARPFRVGGLRGARHGVGLPASRGRAFFDGACKARFFFSKKDI